MEKWGFLKLGMRFSSPKSHFFFLVTRPLVGTTNKLFLRKEQLWQMSHNKETECHNNNDKNS